MISLKKVLSQLTKEHKRGYNQFSAPDSIKNRSMSMRKAGVPDSGDNPLTGEEDPDAGNDQQANGAEIAKKMEFDKSRPRALNDISPLAMMDIVFDMWGGYDDEDEMKKREEEAQRKKQVGFIPREL